MEMMKLVGDGDGGGGGPETDVLLSVGMMRLDEEDEQIRDFRGEILGFWLQFFFSFELDLGIWNMKKNLEKKI